MECWEFQMGGVEGMVLFQHEVVKRQEMNKCCMDSYVTLQFGHLEGSTKPLFLRFFAVRSFPCRRVHMKNLTFGIASALFKIFQGVQIVVGYSLLLR